MEEYCFCWINNADVTSKQWEIPETKCYFQNPEGYYTGPAYRPPHTHASTAPNKKVVPAEGSVFPPLQLSHIILQTHHRFRYPAKLLLCHTTSVFARAVPPTWNTLFSLSLVNVSRKPSEFTLPFATTTHASTRIGPSALLCASKAPKTYLPHDTHTIQLVLIICGFRIYEFTHSLKLISNPKINTHGAFTVICEHVQSSKKSESPHKHIPSWDQTGDFSHTLN